MAKSNPALKNKDKKIKERYKEIYMDYASSVKPNASSIHKLGISSRKELEESRKKVASVLGARPNQIIFTSGGTESNNLAIQGVVLLFFEMYKIVPHIVTTNIEHPSVLETFELLKKRGLAEVSVVPVENNGIVDPKKIRKVLKPHTVLVSVMYANNEIGTIQPIKEIAKEIRHFRKKSSNLENSKRFAFENSLPVFHTDAVQAVNYLDLNVEKLGVDLLSLSGSKIEGAGSGGILYKKGSVNLEKVFGGGDQEGGLRAGTENIDQISKLVDALVYIQKIKDQESKRLNTLRVYFLKKLKSCSKNIFGNENYFVINGDLENRLPNNMNITIPNIPSDLLVIEMSEKGIHLSSKSACKSGDGKVSYVIKAINENIKETDGSLRFSFGRDTNKADMEYTIKSLSEILLKLKKWYI